MNDYSPKYAADALRKLCSTIAKDNYVDTITPTGMHLRFDKGSCSIEEILLLMEQYGRIIHKNGESTEQRDVLLRKINCKPSVSFEELYQKEMNAIGP